MPTSLVPPSGDGPRDGQGSSLPPAPKQVRAAPAGRLVSYTLFTDPKLGRVGRTEEQSREEGRDIEVAQMPMIHVARALEVDETRGLMKAVVDGGGGR